MQYLQRGNRNAEGVVLCCTLSHINYGSYDVPDAKPAHVIAPFPMFACHVIIQLTHTILAMSWHSVCISRTDPRAKGMGKGMQMQAQGMVIKATKTKVRSRIRTSRWDLTPCSTLPVLLRCFADISSHKLLAPSSLWHDFIISPALVPAAIFTRISHCLVCWLPRTYGIMTLGGGALMSLSVFVIAVVRAHRTTSVSHSPASGGLPRKDSQIEIPAPDF